MIISGQIKQNIPSELKFSRVFKGFSNMQISQNTHEEFIKKYLLEEGTE